MIRIEDTLPHSDYLYRVPCLPKCPGCGESLNQDSCQSTSWERSPYGDEFSDELHQCKKCLAWSLVTFVDRFSGPDDMKIEGPLTDDEAEEQKTKMLSQRSSGIS